MTWLPPARGAGTPLFCLPHGGAGASAYQRWPGLLPPDVEVVPVRLPGREARFAEPPARTVAEVVTPLLPALLARAAGTRYRVFGHSLGGLLAYAVARAATGRGHPPEHLVVSGCPAPHRLPRPGAPTVHTLPDAALLAHVRTLAGPTAAAALDVPDLARVLLPVLRADYAVFESYHHEPGPPLPFPVTVLAGTDDPEVTDAELAAWRDLTTGPVVVHRLPGDHLYLVDHPELAVTALLAGT